MWENYINVLPHYYNTVLYYTPKQMEDLKVSHRVASNVLTFKVLQDN